MAEADLITSSANPLIKRIRALAEPRRRRSEQAFFCEGGQTVWRAVEAGADIEVLVVAPELIAGSPAERLVAERQAAGLPVAKLSADLFGRLSGRDGPSGIGAVVRGTLGSLEDLEVAADSLLVVLHEVANPGNLGSIIRTADAAGVHGVVLLGSTTDPFAPAAVKASMGSLFSVSVVREVSVDKFFDWARAREVSVLTTSARAENSYLEADYRLPLALVFGSEGEGLSREMLDRGDSSLFVPMVGTASSLNLSVAVGVVVFEARRRRT